LENVVFFELKKRGFSLSVGKWADREIEFIAEKAGECHYYQITATTNSP
jgi:predicted AAA+ superfamily ATPase